VVPVFGRAVDRWSISGSRLRRHDRPLGTGGAMLGAGATKMPMPAATPTEVRVTLQAVPITIACTGTTCVAPS
jgi:hypothetical protein